MARSTLAPLKGFDYQALFFWTKALEMLIDEHIQKVIFESEDIKVVDDIVVYYKNNYRDDNSGQKIDIDFFQLKYHMTLSNAFSSENLKNPNFVGNKQSLIQRLFSVYQILTRQDATFRLIIVSPWPWAANDPLYSFIDESGAFTKKLTKIYSFKMLDAIIQHFQLYITIFNL